MSSVWVVNAAPLIFLAKIGHLDLLERLAARVIVPSGVAQEVRDGPPPDPARQWVEGRGSRLIRKTRTVSPAIAAWDLGLGESQVIHVALGQPGSEAILDDRAARECAAALGVSFRGTISVLGMAKRRGLVPALRPLLDDLVAKGFHVARPILDQALELAGE